MIRPPRLRSGARVLLIAPAGPVSAEKIDTATARCRELGLEPVLGQAAAERRGYLAGRDAARAADLQRGIADPEIDAVWAIRGGYGTMRLLPHVDFAPLLRRPKPFIGFSDNTAVHLALGRLGVISFHGPHAGAEHWPPLTDESFRRVLFEPEPAGVLPAGNETPRPLALAPGEARGRLLGGNLALLAACCGTPVAPQARGSILLIEDVGEPLYRIDRMLVQLALAGALDGAAAVAFGRITETPASTEDPPLADVLREWAEPLGIPAAAELPFGHVDENWTLPLGAEARLHAGAGTLEILEPAVT